MFCLRQRKKKKPYSTLVVLGAFRLCKKTLRFCPAGSGSPGLVVKMENQFRSSLKEYYPVSLDPCAPTALATTPGPGLALFRQSGQKFQPLPSWVVMLRVGLS
jgi:hypothetical protein